MQPCYQGLSSSHQEGSWELGSSCQDLSSSHHERSWELGSSCHGLSSSHQEEVWELDSTGWHIHLLVLLVMGKLNYCRLKQITFVTSVSSEIPASRNCCSKLNIANQTLRAILGALYDRTKCHQYWGIYSMSPVGQKQRTMKHFLCRLHNVTFPTVWVERTFQRQLITFARITDTYRICLGCVCVCVCDCGEQGKTKYYLYLHRRYVMCYENQCFERLRDWIFFHLNYNKMIGIFT